MIHLGDLGTQETCWGYAGGIRCYRKDHPLEENEWDSIRYTRLFARKLFIL